MKKVKLVDVGRGGHFFLSDKANAVAVNGTGMAVGITLEGLNTEFVAVRHFPECAQQDVPDGYTLVEAAEALCEAPFDKGGNNDWRVSSLRKYLHENYFPKLLESFPELKEAAVTFLRDLTADDGLKDYGACEDTVSLLTADEYRANRDIYMDPPGTWRWLITPDSTPPGGGSSFVRYVTTDGTLYSNSACYGGRDVRPALYLKSDLLVSVEVEDEDEPTPEQREMALYKYRNGGGIVVNEKTNSTAVAVKVQCFAGRLKDFKDAQAGGTPLGTVECSIAADVENGTVTFHAASKDVVIAVRFDELLEIMSEGVVLSHQLHDAEASGGEGDGGE